MRGPLAQQPQSPLVLSQPHPALRPCRGPEDTNLDPACSAWIFRGHGSSPCCSSCRREPGTSPAPCPAQVASQPGRLDRALPVNVGSWRAGHSRCCSVSQVCGLRGCAACGPCTRRASSRTNTRPHRTPVCAALTLPHLSSHCGPPSVPTTPVPGPEGADSCGACAEPGDRGELGAGLSPVVLPPLGKKGL